MTKMDPVEQSFKNAIHFHQEKLTCIRNGEKATDHFTESVLKGLRKNGLFVTRRGTSHRAYSLTLKAIQILDEIENEELDPVEQSFKNAVYHHRHELTNIRNGAKSTNHLNERRRKRLVKHGILFRVYGRGWGRLKLSEKAAQTLDEIENEEIASKQHPP